MTDFRTISIDDSITQLVRRRLRSIKQVDSNGKKQFNPIGLPKKMRFDIVKIKLMRALGKMESSDDFMPLLREMATKDA
jgi:hypothetical protein